MHNNLKKLSNFITKKFLNYWKPSLAIFIESEIWPNIILNLKDRNTPLILLNARITKKTYKKWKKISFFSKSILEITSTCPSQSINPPFFFGIIFFAIS